MPRPALAFALLSSLLALVTMHLVGTQVLDEGAYRLGIVIAGGAGLATSIGLTLLDRRPSLRRHAWAFVLAAGALVGIGMQLVLLLRKPELRTYVLASGLTTQDPFAWAIAGAPLGAIPALVVAAAVQLTFRLTSPVPAHDDRERLMLPFAAACCVVAAAANGFAGPGELPITLGMTLLAGAALAEIRVADWRRARWLHRVFSGDDKAHEIVPVASFPSAMQLPRVVAGAPVGAVIVRIEGETGYRSAARGPVASTALTPEETLAPLRLRTVALMWTLAMSGAALLVALAVR